MKLFTIEEANALLPAAGRIVRAVRRDYGRLSSMREEAQRAAEGAKAGGGGMQGGAAYLASLSALAEHVGQLEGLGVQLKDYERGLIDFPHVRDGRVVLLCWQLGEGDRLEWWHEQDAGFAGRQPL